MIFKFKSKSDGDLIMLEPAGRRVLEVIGKEAGASGIITAQQIPAAVAALEAAIAHEEAIKKPADTKSDEQAFDDEHRQGVSLRQRAKPFLDMLRRNQVAQTDVVWGV